MIEKVKIKNLLYVSSLVLLLLLSPCSVRNQLQSTFGIPQTEAQNVSKTVVNSNCNVNTLEEAGFIPSSIASQSAKVFINNKTLTTLPKIALNRQSHFSKSRESWDSNGEIPYYILFKKLKLHV